MPRGGPGCLALTSWSYKREHRFSLLRVVLGSAPNVSSESAETPCTGNPAAVPSSDPFQRGGRAKTHSGPVHFVQF